jgi:hypothetical protein
MRNATANYITAINQDTRTFYARLLYNGVPVVGDIKQIALTQGSTFDGIFAPGAVFSPYVEVTIDNCPETLQGKELRLEIGVADWGVNRVSSHGILHGWGTKNQTKYINFPSKRKNYFKIRGRVF